MATGRHITAITLLAAALVAALSATGGAALGQSPTAAQQPSFATIAGIVVDSIHGGPLVGASVTVDGSLRQGLSDSSGRFRIDSIEPGQRRIGVFHPLLDSLGFAISTPPLTLKPGAPLLVGLATPSASTVVAQYCGNAAAPADGQNGPALLTGRILDADTDEPVAGIRVSLSWARRYLSSAGVHRVLVTRDTMTGANGAFHFCRLPAGLNVLVRATRARIGDTTATNEIIDRQYVMGNQLVGIVALHVAGAALASAPRTSQAVATLSGRVVHANGAPAAGARVLVLGSADSTMTSDSGLFTLHRLHPGTRTLVVRAIGFEPVATAVEISTRETPSVKVALGLKIEVLDSIKVVGQLNSGYMRVGFEQRRHGTGHFLSAEDIAKIQAVSFLELFNTVPGLRVDYGADGEPFLTATRNGGGCVGYIVDGLPYREMVPGDIDSFLHPAEIGAIEVYDPTQVPGQDYAASLRTQSLITQGTSTGGRAGSTTAPSTGRGSTTASSGGCTVVVIWTKAHLGVY